ncbi:uncharacterized protein Z519_00989 [Cladophialophora bantiana CBS 173.52]|uniref:Telomeric single stranded DNA binding POT1/Cdc13 domain-containing protein n=1 Tax=Cladophialophora bantiana (strain ATCC 10958 / CBS 173.52 / CDC B-1940 / NIH 8579) TaxID=1442370 RepID=A0A0D2FB38_CLAB1|nr:uncharacterized protein Z519_00989 [Cladophialophora bantiana CBS 173.52]KIW99326.1 hypothetical protein Z519_00989 [Cladophialophora bantiana CBS 173.52]
MTAVVPPQPTAPTPTAKLDTTTQTPIADLSPSHTEPAAHILAQVALVWPYSSSTGTLALLLADPDIRRRKSKGQVKVVFRSGCAREVAKTQVGIGDTVKLALVGCEWKETGSVVSTPGRKINWDLEYSTRVLLQVLQGDQETVGVDFTGNETNSSTANGVLSYLHGGADERPMLNGVIHHQSSTIHVPYLTPRKPVGNHSIGTFIDAAFESSAADDGYILGRGRKRTKFARSSGAWSLIDFEEDSHLGAAKKADVNDEDAAQGQSPQAKEVVLAPEPAALGEEDKPEPQTASKVSREDVHQFPIVQATEEDVVDISSSTTADSIFPRLVTQPLVMGPPQTPLRASPHLLPVISGMDDLDASDGSEAATTPRLLPIPSPGLPLVSPLVHRSGVEIGYFQRLDVSISQLDASSEKEKRAIIPDIPTGKSIDHQSLHSDEPSVVVEEISMSQDPVEGFETKVAAHRDTVQVSPESEMEIEDQGTAKKPAYEAPQWLSSLESSIDRELFHSRNEPAAQTETQRTPQTAEVEDDDLYGAPVDMPKASGSFTTSPSVEQPRSPLDVLEQFLQMSPVTATRSLTPFESTGWKIAPNTPPQQVAPENIAIETEHEKTPVSAVENRSPGMYPESQSPFKQNRDHPASPDNLTRPSSSQASRPQSLDGNIDEQDRFREYVKRLSQGFVNVGSSKQLIPDTKSSQDGTPSQIEVDADVSAATIKVDEEPHVESTEYIAEDVDRGTRQPAMMEGVKDKHLSSAAMGREMKLESNLIEHVDTHESHALLPTPDQSQVQRLSPEPETPKAVQELTEAALLSPRYTQQEIEGDSQESVFPMPKEATAATCQETETVWVSRGEATLSTLAERAYAMQEPSQETQKGSDVENGPLSQPMEAGTSPAIVKPISTLPLDTVTPRRSSQRLLARKSSVAANISSPYFTPRKSTQQLHPSLMQKENIHPATDDSSLPSSPTQEDAEAPLLSTVVQEVEQVDPDTVLVSPYRKTNRSISTRDTGTTTPLAYFTHLRLLHEHFGHLVDVIAACTDSSPEPEQSKAGRKDYHTILRLADPSLASEAHSAISVQVFRPFQTALPTAHRGDVVVLRNFKVQTFRRQLILLSTDTSSWAVFKARAGAIMSWSDVVISGPPLEYGPAETNRVRLLFSWWNRGGEEMFNVEPPTQAGHLQAENGSPNLRHGSPRLKESPQASRKVTPTSRRRKTSKSEDFSNGGEMLEHLGSRTSRVNAKDDDKIADRRDENETFPHPANMTIGTHSGNGITGASVRRRRANETDNFGNEGDEDVALIGDDWEQSTPLSDKTNRRRESTISTTAPSESGKPFTPRRSARRRKRSPSLVHELRDGTRYVDADRRRSGSVVHELRDGATYVDE